MGMDAETFYQLSPKEFEKVFERWKNKQDEDYKERWEQIRLICYHTRMPELKPVRLLAFMKFPWDLGRKKGSGPVKKDPERFERLKQKYGEKL